MTYQFSSLGGQPGVSHFVSTRHGGASLAPYAGLNLSYRVGDPAERVLANRQRLADVAGIELDDLVASKQVHGTHVETVTRAQRGRGARDYESALEDTDAVITDEPGMCLLIMAADCVPVLLFDPRRRVVGIAHAGWRGTVARVVQITVAAMSRDYACNPSDFVAAIGPSIGPGDYEVGDEVVAEVQRAFPETWSQQIKWSAANRPHFDLWTSNRLQLIEAGVPPSHVEVAGISTYAAFDTFYSERREGRPSGRFAAGIMLRP